MFTTKKIRQIPCIVGLTLMRSSQQVVAAFALFFALSQEVRGRSTSLRKWSSWSISWACQAKRRRWRVNGSPWSDITSALALEQRPQLHRHKVPSTARWRGYLSSGQGASLQDLATFDFNLLNHRTRYAFLIPLVQKRYYIWLRMHCNRNWLGPDTTPV